MCSICHDRGPDYKASPNEIAHEHGDGNFRCIRAFDLNTGGDYELRCVDCGEVVEGMDHCCYE